MAPPNASSVRSPAALSLKARQESGRCEEPNKPFQPWRGEMSGDAASDASYSPLRGPARERKHRDGLRCRQAQTAFDAVDSPERAAAPLARTRVRPSPGAV